MTGERMSNEGKVCDAAVKFIEQRTGKRRNEICMPEETGVGPPVELRLKIGTRDYAIEHTQIEAFEGQIFGGIWLERFVCPVERALVGKLPGPAYYHLTFPWDRQLVLKKSSLRKCQQTLESWIRDNAQLLCARVQERIRDNSVVIHKDFLDSITAKPSGFSYTITLSCHFTAPPCAQELGQIKSGRWLPDEKTFEALCTQRLRRALCDKLPKLFDCKREGARTVLVLESDDFILDENRAGDLLDGLRGEYTGKLPFPDEIYIVKTGLRNGFWLVWLKECDGERCSLEDQTNFAKFRDDELTDLNPK